MLGLVVVGAAVEVVVGFSVVVVGFSVVVVVVVVVEELVVVSAFWARLRRRSSCQLHFPSTQTLEATF